MREGTAQNGDGRVEGRREGVRDGREGVGCGREGWKMGEYGWKMGEKFEKLKRKETIDSIWWVVGESASTYPCPPL